VKLVYNDESHSYWLDGKRVKSASKVANISADSYALELWRDRMVAIGMTLDSTLAEDVAVDLDNKKAINKICERAKTTAKASVKASRGTQRHRVLELLLLGREDMFITDQQRADAEVLKRTIDAYQLEPMPDRVEQFVAWPEHGVVGRYDAIFRHGGRCVMTDLKSGENAVLYPHSTVVQEALYAFAPRTSLTVAKDGDQSTVTEWTTMPDDLDREIGYVIYASDEHEVGELWRINLAHGKAGADLVLSIVDWRKAHNYGKDLARQVAAPASPAVEQRTPEPELRAGSGDDRRTALLARYQGLGDTERAAFVALNLPKDDLDAVEDALNSIDTFNKTVAEAPQQARNTVAPRPHPPDEGGPVNDTDVEALRTRFNALVSDARVWAGDVVAQGNVGFTWRINEGKPTVRRYELYRGVLALAEWCDGNPTADGIIRAIVEQTLHASTPDNTTPGEALGLLDATQATQFANIAHDIINDKFALVYDEDGAGTPRLQPVAT
jgi:hypothetical protein